MTISPAIRHTLRGVPGWLLLAIAAAHLSTAIHAGTVLAAIPYTMIFAGTGLGAFGLRLSNYNADVRRQGEADAYNARQAAQRAEQEARLAAILAETEARRQAREDEARDQIAQGLRCPEWCTGCEEDRRRSEEANAAFLAARAARHGHPNAQDLAELETRETVRTMS